MDVSGLWFLDRLFCLTHFTFVNFSYPYDTNLFSYLPFISNYAFNLTDHVETGQRPGSTGHHTSHQRRHHICLDMGRMITCHTGIALMAEL